MGTTAITKCEKLQEIKRAITLLYQNRKEMHPAAFRIENNKLRCELYRGIIAAKKAPCYKKSLLQFKYGT